MPERFAYRVRPMVVQLGVKLTYSPPLIAQDSFLIKGDLSFQHVIDGTGQFVSQDGQCLALTVLFLQFGGEHTFDRHDDIERVQGNGS
jgi:hypothetical protein